MAGGLATTGASSRLVVLLAALRARGFRAVTSGAELIGSAPTCDEDDGEGCERGDEAEASEEVHGISVGGSGVGWCAPALSMSHAMSNFAVST